MKLLDVQPAKAEAGEYCQKRVPGCYCGVGWPYEYMCIDCRDKRAAHDNQSRCVCPPPPLPVNSGCISVIT